MKNVLKILGIIFFSLLDTPSIAAKLANSPSPTSCISKSHPSGCISKKMSYCFKKSSNTLEMSQCFETAEKEWNTALNAVYQKLLNAIQEPALKESFKEMQRNWVINRDKQFAFIHNLYTLTGGTIAVLNEAGSRILIIKHRVSELTDIYNSAYHMEGPQ
ncbi:MAG: DUF1311 domain-containing protein [Proteobacteria bacterium]|nr:DUF1311 domain-containing protein [Pseudomonadota bacterium]